MTDLSDNERTWDAHTSAEFVAEDVDATMATMTDDPIVVHVATAVGARGGAAVRQFYTDHFVKHQAADMALQRTSRTVTQNCVVDEMTVSFTHDVEIPWIFPGVAPTGRRVVLPIVTVIGMVDGLVATEHIYWDQASALAQVGLIDPSGLPITGAEQVDAVQADPSPRAFNALLPPTDPRAQP